MSFLPDALVEAWEAPWQPVSRGTFIGFSAGCLGLWALAQVFEPGWVPLLDGVNLLFHEAGHPLFGIFGWETLTILGGTLMQLLVPLLVLGNFWYRRQAHGVATAGVWAFENLLNIARYVADARAQLLPLVGGGEHDWTALLGQWGLLARDHQIGRGLQAAGWIGMIGCWAWLAWRHWTDRRG